MKSTGHFRSGTGRQGECGWIEPETAVANAILSPPFILLAVSIGEDRAGTLDCRALAMIVEREMESPGSGEA